MEEEPSPSPSRVAAEPADLLSSLPAALLEEILRRLGLRDAVRTSALSRAWRRRWESVPGLALCFPEGTPPGAVDRVLLLYYTAPRVSRFAFHHLDAGSASHIDHWLLALSRRNVQSISFRWRALSSLTGFRIHSSIFSCAHLVSLELNWCHVPPTPLPVGFAGFPVLEELYLRNVDFFFDRGEKQLQAIVLGSPLLRVLCLEDVVSHVDCLIEAPNLHSLTLLADSDSDFRFGDLPCLQSSSIRVRDCQEDGHDFVRFLAGVAHVRELTLFSPASEIKIDTIPFIFYNLKSLELSTHFLDMNPVLLMFGLLRSSLNLEKT